MNPPSLSGHESFHCRHYWLKKGFDFINEKKNFRDDDAVVHLGVGKNMVASIRYWLRSFALTDENDAPTELAYALLKDDGFDPYLEDIGTVYLLHYLLTVTQKEYSAYLLFEIVRKARPEFNLGHFHAHAEAELKSDQSAKVVNTAFQVILRSYLSKDKGPMDEMHSGFLQELNLIETAPRLDGGFMVKEGARPDLHPLILLASLKMQNPGESNFEFEGLMLKQHSVGKVFALTRDGLYQKLQELTEIEEIDCQLTDYAGVRELYLGADLSFMDILSLYYAR